MSPNDKPLVWFAGEVRSPPFTQAARIEAGFLLRRLQHGVVLSMPHSRPMPSIGPRCHGCGSATRRSRGESCIGWTPTRSW